MTPQVQFSGSAMILAHVFGIPVKGVHLPWAGRLLEKK
jgi:hypothetical protein